MNHSVPTGQKADIANTAPQLPWHAASITALVKEQARSRRGHLGEILAVVLAETGVAVLGLRLAAHGWPGAIALGLLFAAVGVVAYFVGQAAETAFRAWHTEQIAVRDDLLAKLAARLPPPLRLAYTCNAARTMAIPMHGGVKWSILIFTDVSIVNLTDRPLILTFHLDTNSQRPDGRLSRARRAQVGNRELIEKHVAEPRLHGPVDIAPFSSQVGNLGFIMGGEDDAAVSLDAKPRVLIHDALSGLVGIVDPMRHQECTLGEVDLRGIGPAL